MRKSTLSLALILLLPLCSLGQTPYLSRPVSITTTNAESSLDPSVYSWQQGNKQQNINLYLPHATSPYTPEVYMQQNNGRLQFSTEFSFSSMKKIQLNYDNAGYNTVYDGNPRYNWGYANPPSTFRTIGSHVLKVKYWDALGNIFYRTFNFEVVPDASEFHYDNATTNSSFYRNKLVLWDTPSSLDSKVILLVEGFDAYNVTDSEFYRERGEQLFFEFLDNNYKIYVLNFAFNAQSMKRNAAVLHAAIEYVSGLNGNNDLILAGASMGV